MVQVKDPSACSGRALTELSLRERWEEVKEDQDKVFTPFLDTSRNRC